MKLSKPNVTLYFDDEDSDLWGALQLIEPEKRSIFIKRALRRTLVAGLSPESFYSERVRSFEEDQGIQSDFDELARSDNDLVEDARIIGKPPSSMNELFELSELFSNEEKTVESSGLPSTSKQAPWEHLLYNVIGVEEDEAIIQLLRGEENNDDQP